MCLHQDGSSRSLVHAAGFHSYHAVFYDINNTDSVFSAKLVQLCDDLRNLHFFSIQCFRNTGFKGHGHIFPFIRSFFRCHAENQHMVVIRFV